MSALRFHVQQRYARCADGFSTSSRHGRLELAEARLQRDRWARRAEDPSGDPLRWRILDTRTGAVVPEVPA